MQAEGEGRDDAEVGTGSANRPEQVGVLVAAGATDLAVGGDDLDLEQVVDRPAEPACQIAEPAAQREARHADVGDEAQRRGQPVQLGLAVHLAQRAAGLDRRRPRLGVDQDPAQPGHVDRQPRVGQRRCRRCCGRRRAPRARGRARARSSPPPPRRPCRWAGRRAPASCRSCRSIGASRPRSRRRPARAAHRAGARPARRPSLRWRRRSWGLPFGRGVQRLQERLGLVARRVVGAVLDHVQRPAVAGARRLGDPQPVSRGPGVPRSGSWERRSVRARPAGSAAVRARAACARRPWRPARGQARGCRRRTAPSARPSARAGRPDRTSTGA